MRVVLSFGLVALLAGCARAPAPADVAPDGGAGLEVVRSPEGPFTVGWDPDTGRGMVSQVLPDGDRFELCLQCRYPGYAGGLWAGSMNGSGFLWIPSTPRRGFSSLNLFCAQDESLWDHEEGLEYDCGWSQNFGRGDDGVRLEYLQGEVLGDGRAGDLVLRSVNRGGCWELIRYLFWPRAAAWWLVATHV
ncbi:MAG: hypothetical protein FJ098_15005, partial [Deltaproteobacteria bacterium]|nr:hypothetical protein [Deltaproteobacteria bacterium]